MTRPKIARPPSSPSCQRIPSEPINQDKELFLEPEEIMKQSPNGVDLINGEEAPSAEVSPDTKADRRVHARYPCRLNGLCKPVGRHQTGKPWRGWIEDVSKEGIRLTLNRRFEPGSLIAVEVDVSKEELAQVFHSAISRFFLVKVVRVLRRKDTKWSLGCRLVKKFTEDDLDSLIEFTGFCHLNEDLESELPTQLQDEADAHEAR
jgi:PilZ domain-containing protein